MYIDSLITEDRA